MHEKKPKQIKQVNDKHDKHKVYDSKVTEHAAQEGSHWQDKFGMKTK